jgi:hypothetical protein
MKNIIKKYLQNRKNKLIWKKLAKEKEYKDDVKAKNEVESFAAIGEFIEYMGVKLLVVGYHKFIPVFGGDSFWVRGINVEWFNSLNEIQRAFIRHNELKLMNKWPNNALNADSASNA